MPTLHEHLQHLQPWYDAHIAPVHGAIYSRNWDEVQAVLDESRAQLVASDFNEDERLALEYEIAMHRLTAMNRLCSEEVYCDCFIQTVDLIRQEPAGPISLQAQAVHQIQLLGAGYRRGLFDLAPAQVDELLRRISPESMTNHVWYYLTAWAFHSGNLKYLERAFGEQMVLTTGYLDDYFWLRTNLMYLIADGRVAKNDVLETIQRYPHPMYLTDFELMFFPRLRPLGLVDEEVLGALANREAALRHLDGSTPQTAPRTRRFMR
jgi:hypothetical protein